ncbi:MAG: HNH endonuclease [Myxococcales bacterium]|nr:HNH endonuclease [Myxococcales bacterium]
MHTRTLVLTPWFFPHKVVRWEDAITLVYLSKVDVVIAYDDEIRSPSATFPMPAVVRLKRQISGQKRGVKFSRINVYVRDGFTCAYCEKKLPLRQLTYDHVLPRSRGGRTEWENIVTACTPCNAKKSNKTPDESGMWPRKRPCRPRSLPLMPPLIDPKTAPIEWRDFTAALPEVGVA